MPDGFAVIVSPGQPRVVLRLPPAASQTRRTTITEEDDMARAENEGSRMNPATSAILRYFEFAHLPPRLAEISEPFHDIAYSMANTLQGPELTAGLRKLLEAKDAFVRAALPAPGQPDA
jgi:hypothetical protein